LQEEVSPFRKNDEKSQSVLGISNTPKKIRIADWRRHESGDCILVN
jgi:hypothetical protein